MAKIYAELIRKGIKTLDNVPPILRDAVDEILRWEEINVPENSELTI